MANGKIIASGTAARARPRGWHLQFYIPGTIVRDLLPFFSGFEDIFVIDHMEYMKQSDGLTQADFDRLVRDTGRWPLLYQTVRALPRRAEPTLVIRAADRPGPGHRRARPTPVGLGLAASSRRAARYRPTVQLPG